MRFLVFFALAFLSACSLKNREGSDWAYLFAYFKTDDEALYLAYSLDARNWKALSNEAVLRSEVGRGHLRDPSLLLGKDGRFHIVWTTAKDGFGYSSTEDFKNWSEQKLIKVQSGDLNSGVRNTWAPELFYDAPHDRYLVVWSSAQNKIEGLKAKFKGDHQSYWMSTKDFRSWSEPKLLFSPEPPFYFIDTFPLLAKGRYYYFLKVESHNRLDGEKDGLAYSWGNEWAGSYNRFSATLPMATADSEGPSVLEVDDGWLIFYDHGGARSGVIFTPDLEVFWDVTASVRLPPAYRHGTALRISRALLNKLKSRF